MTKNLLRASAFVSASEAIVCLLLAASHASGQERDRQKAPLNRYGAPVLTADGQPIYYDQRSIAAMSAASLAKAPEVPSATAAPAAPGGFIPAAARPHQPFWNYAAFGGAIGASNIVICPALKGQFPEILLGGTNNYGPDNFWQSLRYNPSTGNYDQVFVSPLFSSGYGGLISRIGLADVIGDSRLEIVVTEYGGRIHIYDFASKVELGYFDSGVNGFSGLNGLSGLSLTDLNGDGKSEIILTTSSDLFVFNGQGTLLWSVPGAGGHDVVAGQLDNDAAIEIATTGGYVIDASTHAIQWTRAGGFGYFLTLAPLQGEKYRQLIAADMWQYASSYDVARQLPIWSIPLVHDISALTTADVDGDGIPEVLIGDNQGGVLRVYDLLTHLTKWTVENAGWGIGGIAVGDVDGDSVPDLLWGSASNSDSSPHFNVARTTGEHPIVWQSLAIQGPFLGPAIGDLDGDGKPELVVCSYTAGSNGHSGRILVFDAATLTLRAVSAPVMDNLSNYGVRALKLADLDGDGRMKILIGADSFLFGSFHNGAIAVYRFDPNNTFTRTWTNTTLPHGSSFNFVEVADLDGNGSREIVAGNSFEDSGSADDGVFLYIYDYPGTGQWRSSNLVGLHPDAVTGLVVQDLDGNGSKEIAVLVSTGDLYTFDGPTRELRSLVQGTGLTTLGSRANPSTLVGADGTGMGHFLQYQDGNYTESLTQSLGVGKLTGITTAVDGSLWLGGDSNLALRSGPSFSSIAWESAPFDPVFGRTVATDFRDGKNRVFSTTSNAVLGFVYDPTEPTFTLNVVSAHGTVTKKPDRPNYTAGVQVTLTAFPSANYRFASWTGNIASPTNPTTVTLDSDKNITANYATDWFELNITAVNGTVLRDPDWPIYPPGYPVTITASPNPGYLFAGWSGDASGTIPTLSYKMYANKNITANFGPATGPTTAPPAIVPNGGTFKKKENVVLTCPTFGATIYYTTDGSDPTTSSPVVNKKKIKLSGKGPHLMKAKAVKTGYFDSAIVSAQFTIN